MQQSQCDPYGPSPQLKPLSLCQDNSPMYLNTFHDAAHPRGVGPRFEHQRLMLYDCQMSFLFISESQALQWLGSRAANASTDLLHHLHDQENFLITAANATLWDAGSGVYLSLIHI